MTDFIKSCAEVLTWIAVMVVVSVIILWVGRAIA